LGICLGRKPPDAAAARDYRDMLEHVVAQNPRGVGMITVVESSSTPTPDGRDAMIRMFKDLWPHLKAAAFVLEARGFAAATQRSVLSAFLLGSGLRQRLQIFPSIESAVPWLAGALVSADASPQPGLSTSHLSEMMARVVHKFCDGHRSR
jgi:hypothetical protein